MPINDGPPIKSGDVNSRFNVFESHYDYTDSHLVLRKTLGNWIWSRFTRKGRIISLLMRKYSVKSITRDHYKPDRRYHHGEMVSIIKLYVDCGTIVIRQEVPLVPKLDYDYGEIEVMFVPSPTERIAGLMGSEKEIILKFKDYFNKGVLNRFVVESGTQQATAIKAFVSMEILAD